MLGLGYGRWGPLIAVFVCPDSFPVVYLVEASQPVCMLGVAVMGDATWLVMAYGAGLSYWLLRACSLVLLATLPDCTRTIRMCLGVFYVGCQLGWGGVFPPLQRPLIFSSIWLFRYQVAQMLDTKKVQRIASKSMARGCLVTGVWCVTKCTIQMRY